MSRLSRYTLLLCSTLTLACLESGTESAQPGLQQAPAERAPANAVLEATVNPVGEVALVAPRTRPPHRLRVPQLDRTIESIFGYRWASLDDLAMAMGQPNLVDVTQEDRSISPLFLKFLNDAARGSCAARVAMDFHPDLEARLIVGVSSSDTFETAPEAMEAALQHVLLLFHGRRITGDELVRWRSLFEEAAALDSPEIGWRTVCVAAMTHPDFYTY
jgi:hypothetical protein